MLGLHSCQSAQEDSAAVRMLPGSTSSLQVNRIVLSLPMKSAFPPSLAPQLLSFHIVSRPLQLNSFVFTSLQETCPRGVCARHSSLFALSREGSIPTQLKGDRKSTRLNSSHVEISYAVFCLKKKRQLPILMTVHDSDDARLWI